MNKHFISMFSRKPDIIASGDYFYTVPWIEAEKKRYGTWTYSEKELEIREKYSKRQFLNNWKKRTFEGAYSKENDYIWLENLKEDNRDSRLFSYFHNIAFSGTPIVDIASSENMGLVPYLLKLNPDLPCLVTDIDSYAMHRLRDRINEFLPENDISIASFDILDIPMADNTVPCITGFNPISSCMDDHNWVAEEESNPNIKTFRDFLAVGEQKALNEIYRVLQPDGIFVLIDTDELELKYDQNTLNKFLKTNNFLYGLHTESILKRLAQIENERKNSTSLKEKIRAAGFKIIYWKQSAIELPPSYVAEYINGEPVDFVMNERDKEIMKLYAPTYVYVLKKMKIT